MVNQKNIKSLGKALPPRSQTEPKSFLGVCNMYRRFIKDYAHIAKPLTRLTQETPTRTPSPGCRPVGGLRVPQGALAVDHDPRAPSTGGSLHPGYRRLRRPSRLYPPAATTGQEHHPGRLLQPGPHPSRAKLLHDQPRMPGRGLGLFSSPPLPRGSRLPDPDGPFQFTLAAEHGQCPRPGRSLAPPVIGVPVKGMHQTGKGAPLCRRHFAAPDAGAGSVRHPGRDSLSRSG